MRALLLSMSLVVAATASAQGPDDRPAPLDPPSARALEARLVAPCCWTQTLDVHESELASSLRTEIRDRLGRGESSLAIEDDLAARYGERIRAVPRGAQPHGTFAIAMTAALLLMAAALAMLARRWARAPAPARSPEVAIDHYDRRLDDELRALPDE